ncbi:MAG: thiamine-phosphate kinase, partial [Verrucomicrobiae bacterium]|nr:thiamine-phosphate kinase [Verrucomicrobiae bacterium]NNJ85999.1 thiamine-phosphate kinase [Akkermansiaceae bacterium]
MIRLSDIGEDALIHRLLKKISIQGKQADDLVVGPGDDCAVINVGDKDRYQLLKTDSLIEGVHYLPDAAAPEVGWKAIARVVSDFAAMGGWPSHLLITVAMPPDQKISYMEELYQGMQNCACEFGAAISGGETTS